MIPTGLEILALPFFAVGVFYFGKAQISW